MISAATPILLMIETSLTPATLMRVQSMIVTRAMKTVLFKPKMVAGMLGKMASNGIGTVNATAVMVSTPAKK